MRSPQCRNWFAFQLVACTLVVGAVGCGHPAYAVKASAAAQKLALARELAAEVHAPFEYYSAREYLAKARSEAAEGDYGDAIELADESEQFAQQAVKRARAFQKRVPVMERGGGR